MGDQPITIFLSAAEASGDEHAAGLIRALKQRLPDARFVGAAGKRMAEAGCEVVTDLTDMATMLGGPLLKLRYYKRQVSLLKEAIRETRPDVFIPVDSPALNWHLAREAKKAGIAVVYYIAPQVWAWGSWRVGKMARLTDSVACILPFEQRYLRDRGVNATYIGNPVFDDLEDRTTEPHDLAKAWAHGKWRVALVPGSRSGEIKGNAKALLAVSKAIQRRWKQAECTFTARTPKDADMIAKQCERDDLNFSIGRTMEEFERSHFAVICSGTVTLQAAHFGLPMVIFYRAGIVMRLLYATIGRFKWMVSTPSLTLVNILAGRRIVPELMPWNGNPKALVKMVMHTMEELGYLVEMQQQLAEVVKPLRPPNGKTAGENGADLVIQELRRIGRL